MDDHTLIRRVKTYRNPAEEMRPRIYQLIKRPAALLTAFPDAIIGQKELYFKQKRGTSRLRRGTLAGLVAAGPFEVAGLRMLG
jgi:hypothetical protein